MSASNTFLREQRALRKLRVADVAHQLEVHPNSVLRWERRERLPGPAVIRALALALDTVESDVAAFFHDARQPSEPLHVIPGVGLRPLRETAGVSVGLIATRLGVHPATVYNWEAGRVRIPEKHLVGLEILLCITRPSLIAELRKAPVAPAGRSISPLRRLRSRNGLSQEAAARYIGTSPRTLGAWERGRRPPLWAVRQMAATYGVPVSRVAVIARMPTPLLDPRQWSAGDLPEVLRALRQWSGLTQAQVADRCGLHPTSVRAYENGRTLPSARSREKLEQLFKLPHRALVQAYTSTDQ